MIRDRPSRSPSPKKQYIKNHNYSPILTIILAFITTVTLGYYLKNMSNCNI